MVWRLTGRRDAERLHGRATRRSGRSPTASRLRPYFAAARPGASPTSSTTKMSRDIAALGARAGGLTAEAAALDRPASGDAGRGGQRRRPRVGARRSASRPGHDGRRHGHEHLPHGARPPARRWPRGCAAWSRTASCPGSSATKPGSRPSATSSPGSSGRQSRRRSTTRLAAAARPSTTSWSATPPGSDRASPGCSPSTGGTAIARSWSTST